MKTDKLALELRPLDCTRAIQGVEGPVALWTVWLDSKGRPVLPLWKRLPWRRQWTRRGSS